MKNQLLILIAALLLPVMAQANKIQSAVWPTQPITIVVPYSPGGLTDQIARSLAIEIEKETQQNVLIKFMPGGTNIVALNHVAKSENDNHTFILTMDDFISGPLSQDNPIFKRFKGVYVTSFLPFVIVTSNPSKTQINSLKNNNPKINLAVVGVNSAADRWAKGLTGISINSISYKGAALAIADLIGGHVDYGVFSIGVVKSQIDAGQMYPVMISTFNRSSKLPKTPTAHELGFKGSNSITWFAFIARDDTNDFALKTFSSILQKIYIDRAPLEFLSERGAEIVNWDLSRSQRFIEEQKKILENTK